MSNYRLSTSSKLNREGVDPKLIEIDDLAITLTLVDYGHGPDSGLRTAEAQNRLYLEHKSKADGYIYVGKHQADDNGLGRALDFYAYVGGEASWDHAHLTMVACAYFQAASLLGYKIKWGGLWKSKDPTYKDGIPYGWDCPHIELIRE